MEPNFRLMKSGRNVFFLTKFPGGPEDLEVSQRQSLMDMPVLLPGRFQERRQKGCEVELPNKHVFFFLIFFLFLLKGCFEKTWKNSSGEPTCYETHLLCGLRLSWTSSLDAGRSIHHLRTGGFDDVGWEMSRIKLLWESLWRWTAVGTAGVSIYCIYLYIFRLLFELFE